MAVEVLNYQSRKIEIPDPLPAGNVVAHQIRLIHDNSEGLVLPRSAGPLRTYDKYPSVYHADFRGDTEYIPPEGIPEYNVVDHCHHCISVTHGDFRGDTKYVKPGGIPEFATEPFEKKRETVAKVLFSYRKNQLFSDWTVPQRFITGHPDAYEPPLHLKSTEEAIEDTKLDKDIEEVPAPPPSPPPTSAKPASRAGSAASVKPPPQMVDRQMSKTLPEIELRKQARANSRDLSRNYARLPDMRGGSAQQGKAVPTVARIPSATPQATARVPSEEKSDDMNVIRQEIEHSFQPHAVDKAEQWMRMAPSTDRRVIERVLRMTERRQKIDNSLNKTLQPDAKATVDSWLTNANEPERQVALKFFNSVAGHQLMGANISEQKRRLQAVVNALENGKAQVNSPKPASASRCRALGDTKSQSGTRLRHLRLLSPGTRQNKWMHSTWHHLPEYKDPDVVNNWSSHYIKPHEHSPRHFVIHPDWG